MKKGTLVKFDEQMVESFILDCKEDFNETEESLLSYLCKKDGELENILNQMIIDGLTHLVSVMPFPLTVVYDRYYVDRIYRDEYYSYFSKKHFGISRNTKRLIFIKNRHTKREFLDNRKRVHKKIEDDLIGMVVIKPTQTLGRMLINPFRINIVPCYVRTTRFELSILGKIYSLEAFPFSGQDSEVMTCAEVNIWQIMEYFGNRYKNYRTILPSEMFELVMDTSDVRLLPSDGLTVEQESHVFMKNGLSPKIYYKRSEYDDGEYMKSYEQYPLAPTFEEILHFYVESGIPILMNLREKGNEEGDNHSVTCVGHALKGILEKNNNASKIEFYKERSVDSGVLEEYNDLNVFKSWSNCAGYVMMEDHSSPYQIRSLDNLKFDDCEDAILYEVESFVAPLYKHVFMAAEDAYEISVNLIDKTRDSIVEGLQRNGINAPYEIVIRLFLATSRAYKDFRVSKAKMIEEKTFYSQVAFPKFVWICEYGTFDTYNRHKALGEFVLDATSAKYHIFEPVISIRNGDSITYRGPVDSIEYAHLRRSIPVAKEYDMYEQNNLKLTTIEGRL